MFHSETGAKDDFCSEDWISSFSKARNKDYIKDEGISQVETENGETLITNVISDKDFGEGCKNSGVLIKFLDAAEHLGIQVHPTRDYARRMINGLWKEAGI